MIFHEVLARALSDQGIDTVFGLLGDGNLYFMDSFRRVTGGTFVSVSNESGGVLAANGYAHTSGGLGVATVTHGPALTNTFTALVESVRDHMPVLLIAGDTPVLDPDNFQDIPQRSVVDLTGAGFVQVRSPQTVCVDVATAVRRALRERRAIVLNVPAEFTWIEADYEKCPRASFAYQAVGPDSFALDGAVGIIAEAQRPVVIAGKGATTPAARAAILKFAARIGAPVATSLQGKDLFRGESHDLGIIGNLATTVALEVMTQADCLIVFGAALNKMTTADGSLVAGKRIVQVDIDPLAIDRWVRADAGVVGDATVTAETFIDWLDEAEIVPTGFASAEMATRLAAFSDGDFTDLSTETTVDIRTALKRVDAAFPQDRTLVLDSGRFINYAFTMLHSPAPQSYVHTIRFGSIGLGMGNAIGASHGAPGRPVLLTTGDGGFMLGGLAEFNTAVRDRVDLVVVVLNDGAYGAEHIQFRNKDMDPLMSMFDWPDFGPVATALGGQGFTVHNLAELDVALAAIPHRTVPMLIDIKIDPTWE